MFGIRIDPKWGGSGQDWWATTAYVEAMSNSDSGSVNMAFPGAIRHGSAGDSGAWHR